MEPITTIATLIASANNAMNLARGLLGAKISHDVERSVSKIIHELSEVTGKLAAAQAVEFESAQRIIQLEKQVKNLKAFDLERDRYALKELAPGALAYVLKPVHQATEPVHSLCCKCYQEGEKSILVHQGYRDGANRFLCPVCKTELAVRPEPAGETVVAVGRGRSSRSMLDGY